MTASTPQTTARPELAFYGLGTFSIAGARPFAGLVMADQVIALDALAGMAESQGLPLIGSSDLLALLQHWAVNLVTITVIAEQLRASHWQHPLLKVCPVPLALLQIHAPIEQPRQLFCSGANYRKHVIDLIVDQHREEAVQNMNEAERLAFATAFMDRRVLGEPYLFSKVNSSISGPYDPIVITADVEQPDWELELAVVIGKQAYQLTEDNAMDAVAGYTLVNDITNRELIHRSDLKAIGTDWLMGKSLPTYSPMGPFLVPANHIDNPHDLRMTLRLNGDVMQNETSADMIFNIPRLLVYLSRRIRLYPGDILITGSPAGNGSHYHRFLKPGDVVESTIEGLGFQRNSCIAG
jgi:2-keto-4-pentenoate hydratase/2-oxohepta-3-ene-1,7-dioic acid hydratase in catechol pathway